MRTSICVYQLFNRIYQFQIEKVLMCLIHKLGKQGLFPRLHKFIYTIFITPSVYVVIPAKYTLSLSLQELIVKCSL